MQDAARGISAEGVKQARQKLADLGVLCVDLSLVAARATQEGGDWERAAIHEVTKFVEEHKAVAQHPSLEEKAAAVADLAKRMHPAS